MQKEKQMESKEAERKFEDWWNRFGYKFATSISTPSEKLIKQGMKKAFYEGLSNVAYIVKRGTK